MLLFVCIVASLAIGAVGAHYATKAGYVAKLNSIRSEVALWQGHAIADVRTFAARVKAFL
jgi:hypothetical protein